MKKKLKDFTLDELSDLCPQTHCTECPFFDSNALCGFINAIGKADAMEEDIDTKGNLGQLKAIEKETRKFMEYSK
jgi:hypothetical protein